MACLRTLFSRSGEEIWNNTCRAMASAWFSQENGNEFLSDAPSLFRTQLIVAAFDDTIEPMDWSPWPTFAKADAMCGAG